VSSADRNVRQLLKREVWIERVRNPPPAGALHGAVDPGAEVPATHYRAVAEVISYVLHLKRRR
jgi:flagellar biosynthesis protein FlhB